MTARFDTSVPAERVRAANQEQPNAAGDWVLYWMIAARRTHWNFALERAVDWARHLNKPLLVFEPLRIGYPWASARFHRFVLEGMRDNAARLDEAGVRYFPYVEPQRDADKGLLLALAKHSAVVVTDDYPAFFLPRMVASAAAKMPVLVETVDGNGLLPLRAADHAFPLAHSFRRFLQKTLRPHLEQFPKANPLARVKLPAPAPLPCEITRRWAPASAALLAGEDSALAELKIDQSVGPASFRGGPIVGEKTWRKFLSVKLQNYPDERNLPEGDGASGLSPYLHFGHFSPHQAFAELAKSEAWTPERLAAKPNGSRDGWWNMSPGAEAFLDQIVTWREVGFNMCAHRDDYDQYESLPDWAQATLKKHAHDKRPTLYSLEELEQAQTYDRLWNAAQCQLVREGRMHNYLRMLWGKKILEWSPSPRDALDVMLELNNKYAVDGRDPNSYSGIFWCLGRYDRAWGPERPIFGKIRYMSSDNTAKKLPVRGYLAKYV